MRSLTTLRGRARRDASLVGFARFSFARPLPCAVRSGYDPRMTDDEKFAAKNASVAIVAAEWIAALGTDLPENWTKLYVRLEDGSCFMLTAEFVHGTHLNWGAA